MVLGWRRRGGGGISKSCTKGGGGIGVYRVLGIVYRVAAARFMLFVVLEMRQLRIAVCISRIFDGGVRPE